MEGSNKFEIDNAFARFVLVVMFLLFLLLCFAALGLYLCTFLKPPVSLESLFQFEEKFKVSILISYMAVIFLAGTVYLRTMRGHSEENIILPKPLRLFLRSLIIFTVINVIWWICGGTAPGVDHDGSSWAAGRFGQRPFSITENMAFHYLWINIRMYVVVLIPAFIICMQLLLNVLFLRKELDAKEGQIVES